MSFQGKEVTKILYLSSGKLLETPTGASDQGYTMAIVWITKPNDAEKGIAFSTEDRYLCIWKRNGVNFTEVFSKRLTGGTEGQEISSMAYNPSSGHLGLYIGSLLWPILVKLVAIPKHWPQAVGFGQSGVHRPELWTFRREDGVIHILNDNRQVLKSKDTSTVIGHASINMKEDAVILDDVSQGIALYKLLGTERLKTFSVPHSECRS
ncbi:hypothetical protein BT96DRAFT_830731 [Gymnopus androsaceus JB14]|uniref:WD40 repeat-like protein n=1 Tax=Gymnopus androsaceus JB14 TaxID=1447944 RepID=A0A6A4H5D4_9AGAR|nr:hypothetical protein BT96DRAFT_830731 [Gymnopus androsaceus JB14]